MSWGQELTKIKFTLDWVLSGGHPWFYLAQDKGYFKDEGLDVTIDQGKGSVAAVTRVMSGAYDAGFTDINAIVQAAATNPRENPIMVYLIFNKAAFAAVTKADGPIKTLKDFEGRSLGAPAGSVSLRLFPIVAEKNGVDMSKVKIINLEPNLVEQALLQDQVDAVVSFTATSYLNFVAMGKDPEKDFRWFRYDELGLDLYSSGVMVSQKLLKENPDAVRGLVKAINRAVREVAANPDEGMAVLQKVEPLIKADVEKARLKFFLEQQMMTPETAEIGLGDLKDQRFAERIATIVKAYELKRTPEVQEVFDRSFLPPRSERELKTATN
jgi:NitT/TauT family transport system substrate-binding protein